MTISSGEAAAMKVEVVPGNELTQELVSWWIDIQTKDERFASPFFRPEFTQAVAATRDDIFVGVMSVDGVVRGFLPFQRSDPRKGGPVGGMMSNYQGVVVEADTQWEPRNLVSELGLSVLEFDHLICSQPEFEPFRSDVIDSLVIDTSQGLDAWIENRRAAGVSTVKKLPRKIRKLERELGPLRFEPHIACDDVLHTLTDWKRAQYQRTHARGSLSFDWAIQAIRHIAEVQNDGFAGVLSALYAGDRLVAVHMGMRSETVWHHWYPAYDTDCAAHSPGLILLWEMIQWGGSNGIAWIDLGQGGEHWKASFATGGIDVAQADVFVRSVAGAAHGARVRSLRLLRGAPALDPARKAFRATRRIVSPIHTAGTGPR